MSSDTSSTGEIILRDSSYVTLPASLVKDINIRLLEREYLQQVVKYKDSTIISKDFYIVEQDNIIKDMQGRILKSNEIATGLNASLTRSRKQNTILKYITGGATLVAILAFIIK